MLAPPNCRYLKTEEKNWGGDPIYVQYIQYSSRETQTILCAGMSTTRTSVNKRISRNSTNKIWMSSHRIVRITLIITHYNRLLVSAIRQTLPGKQFSIPIYEATCCLSFYAFFFFFVLNRIALHRLSPVKATLHFAISVTVGRYVHLHLFFNKLH